MVVGGEKEAREANGLVVLVADDDPAVCNLCREVAGSLGLRVRLAASTEEALEKVEQQRVDLVL
ncbi:MAG: response regulator, partial [Terriglobia bacterium]